MTISCKNKYQSYQIDVRLDKIKKINLRKIKFLLLLIVLVQIFLLMNMNVAESYIIHQTDDVIGRERKIQKDLEKGLIDVGINLLIGIFSIKQIGFVSAKEIPTNPSNALNLESSNLDNLYNPSYDENNIWNCCPQTINGAICQNIFSEDIITCAKEILPTKCENVIECKPGCCFDSVEGLCATNSPKIACENSGGVWDNEETCLIQECQRGCCVMGNDVQFITETRCEKLSLIEGVEKDFKNTLTESECLAISASQNIGACIFKEDICRIRTEQKCLSDNGKFYKNYLCSHLSLETGCEKQNSTGCVKEKDEIYWFDSCGNRENIYSSDRNQSWNNGIILSKNESCGAGLSNTNSDTCGNCNYYLGSMCSETNATDTHILDRDYVCEDLKCYYIDEWGNFVTRDNLESWCVYDGYIGDGKDAPGSRHWRRMCVEGEIKIEPCADYRGQICAQYEIKREGKILTTATCEINEALSCIMDNGGEKGCAENKDCMVKSVFIDKYFQFDQCVARYPRGFNLKETSEEEARLCSTADRTCIVFYRKNWKGEWNCKENCDCKTSTFVNQMNDVCIALGDCGTYVNYIGEGTNNVAVTRTPNTNWGEYIKYSNPVEGQYAEPKENRSGSGSWSAWSGGEYDRATPQESIMHLGERIWKNSWRELKDIWVVGWIIAFYLFMVLIGVIILMMIFGYVWELITGWGDTKKYYVHFSCHAWQAPVGGKDCDKCDDDPLKPCSKYRCESLGQACVLLNEKEENPICGAIGYEAVPPVISAGEIISVGYGFFNEENKRVEIRKNTSECIPEFTPVVFNLKTDEYAQCKFDLEPNKDYEEFISYPIEGTKFGQEHSFAFSMPSLDSFNVYNVEGDLKEMFGNMNFYVKCMDYYGNVNLKEYTINFCINLGPDLTAPRIVYSEPLNHAFLKYNTTESPLTIYLNEPAECRFDIEDKEYDNMLNEMNCKTEIDEAELYGWACNTTLVNLVNDSNIIYLKCKDQPWKPAEEDNLRNINSESYIFTLHKTKYALKIDSISPQGEIEEGFEPVAVELEVKTSGGVNDGESICYYRFSEYKQDVIFFDTFSWKHKQKFDMMMQGDYNIDIRCEDDAGNTDYGSASFSLNIDSSPPLVVRVYKKAEKLTLITDESAECYYDFNRCNFNIDDSTSITVALSTEHTTNWITGQTYHIKCKDIWGNTNPDCAIKISPSRL